MSKDQDCEDCPNNGNCAEQDLEIAMKKMKAKNKEAKDNLVLGTRLTGKQINKLRKMLDPRMLDAPPTQSRH